MWETNKTERYISPTLVLKAFKERLDHGLKSKTTWKISKEEILSLINDCYVQSLEDIINETSTRTLGHVSERISEFKDNS